MTYVGDLTTIDELEGQQRELIYAWRDPEFWGAPGLGCSHCHERPPILQTSFGAVCDVCLERWVSGWDFERIVVWLGAQKATNIRHQERKEAWMAWNKRGDISKALEYERKYGVWILQHPHP